MFEGIKRRFGKVDYGSEEASGLDPIVREVESSGGDFIQAIIGGASLAGTNPKASSKALLQSYSRMPWLRAVVHKVAKSSAAVTWQLFSPAPAGNGEEGRLSHKYKMQWGDDVVRRQVIKAAQEEGEIVEITDHPLLDLLNLGTELFPGVTSSHLIQVYLDLIGEAIQLKERGGMGGPGGRGEVTSLLPIPPTWVRELPSQKKPFFMIQFGSTAVAQEVSKDDVIFYRDPDPLTPFGRGVGTALSLADELQTSEAAALTIRSRLENNAIPPFLAMPDGTGTPPDNEQLARIREDWERRLRGPTKTGFVHFLRNRFKFERLGNTFEELSLIPLLKHQRDTIIQVYGVPPEMLGILAESNRATITAAEVLFARHVLVPRLEFRRSVLQRSLVPEFGDQLILDFVSPVPEDKEFMLKVAQALPWVFTANEIRELGGMESLGDEGDVFGVPSNVFIQPDLGTVIDEGGGEEPPEGAAGIKAEIGKISAQDRQRARKISELSDETVLIENVMDDVREGMSAAGQARLDTLGLEIAFDLQDPAAISFLGREAADQITKINNTTRKAIQRVLVEGIEAGEDINSLARRIRGVFKEARGRRSIVIARTESVRAMNAGQVVATKQAGFEGKQWLSTRDGKVRDTHGFLDGQIVAVLANFVSSSGATGPFPGALGTAEEDVQCRCTTLSVARLPPVEAEETPFIEFDTINPFDEKTRKNSDNPIENFMRITRQRKWREGLTKGEEKGLKDYTGIGYRGINKGLRKGKVREELDRQVIRELDDALAKARTPANMVVWRTVEKSEKVFGGEISEKLIGKTFRDNGFMSTTLNRPLAENFVKTADSTLIKIKVPKDTKAGYLGWQSDELRGASSFGWEHELLLERGHEFRVVNIFTDDMILPTLPGQTGALKQLRIMEVELTGNVTKVDLLKLLRQMMERAEEVEVDDAFLEGREDKYVWTDALVDTTEEEKQAVEVMWPPNLDTEAKREQTWKAGEAIRLPIQRQLFRAFRRAFSAQEKLVLAGLK